MKEKIYYVYGLIDPKNGLPFYIGKGRGERMYHHHNAVRNGIKLNNKHLYYKIKQLHNEHFVPKYNKIWISTDEEFCYQLEKYLIQECQAIGINLCNIMPGGNGWKNSYVVSEETKERIRQAHLGKKASKKTKIKMSESAKGRKFSKETRKKLSEAHKGKILSKEHKKKLSETLKKIYIGRKRKGEIIPSPMKGKRHTIETKRKISESGKGKHNRSLSEETKNKIRESLKGYKCSEETRKKLSELHKGKKLSIGMRQKISKTLMGHSVSEKAKQVLLKYSFKKIKFLGIKENIIQKKHGKD